jgi:hypothetical protein
MDLGHDGEKTPMRTCLSGNGEKAITPEKMAPCLSGIWPHYRAHQNRLRDVPAPTEHCSFLVFEDFVTTGLCGDPLQWRKKEGVKNGFFTFSRDEGQSDEEEGDRGRWGDGNFVFPRSSAVSNFLAVTIRHDNRCRLLMGCAILKAHAIDKLLVVFAPAWSGRLNGGSHFGRPDLQLVICGGNIACWS